MYWSLTYRVWTQKRRAAVCVLLVSGMLLAACGGAPPEEEPPVREDVSEEEPPVVEDVSEQEPAELAEEEEPVAVIEEEPEQPVTVVEVEDDFMGKVDRGDVLVDQIVSAEGGTTGEVVAISLTNPGDAPLDLAIPCGLILTPNQGGEQRMMVLQEIFITVGPGETVIIDVFVVCIDSLLMPPSPGSTYTLGGLLPPGQLNDLMECLCEQDLASEVAADPLTGEQGLQMAVWAAADGTSVEDLQIAMDDAEGALGSFSFEDVPLPDIEELEGIEDMPGFEEGMEEALAMLNQSGEVAVSWLELCGIDPGQ